jgi:(4-(4-[2-(gamma-L-glutamylamino)ethyl]phenoxymethyl)furan-2-yl)methanamine synthase
MAGMVDGCGAGSSVREGDLDCVIGWDVGGAHLKAARAEHGRIVRVVQMPMPLWLGLERLQETLATVSAELGVAERHVATMTGELADVFSDRAEGVVRITQELQSVLGTVVLYGGRAGMLPATGARDHVSDIASANWHASAALAGRFVGEGLFVDIGSTTADVVPVHGGTVAARGYSDAERLACGELVYTGMVRTPLMALASRAPVKGSWAGVAAELFATAADVYRVLRELPEDVDQMPSADGREKSVPASCARLARMVGYDAAASSEADWREVAAWFAEAQLRRIMDGAMLVLSRATLSQDAPVIAAGAGRHLVARLAARLGRRCVDFQELIPHAQGVKVGQCAPAAAVALLLGGASDSVQRPPASASPTPAVPRVRPSC